MRGLRALAIAGAMAGPLSAAAQDLSEALTASLSDFEQVDGLPDTLRCTALYRSLGLVLGDDSALAAEFERREGVTATIAASLWGNAPDSVETTPEEVFAVLLPPIDAATTVVMDHMSGVMEATDAPFDEQVFSAIDFCNALVEALQPSDP